MRPRTCGAARQTACPDGRPARRCRLIAADLCRGGLIIRRQRTGAVAGRADVSLQGWEETPGREDVSVQGWEGDPGREEGDVKKGEIVI